MAWVAFADGAAAELVAQDAERINARVVAVAPPETEAVPSHRLDVVHADEHGHAVRLDPELARPFIRAGRAGAMLAEVADGIYALVAVVPFDAEDPVLDPGHVLRFDRVIHGLPAINCAPTSDADRLYTVFGSAANKSRGRRRPATHSTYSSMTSRSSSRWAPVALRRGSCAGSI